MDIYISISIYYFDMAKFATTGKQQIPQGLRWIKAIMVLEIIGGILSLVLKKTLFTSIGFLSGALDDIFIVVSLVIMILIWIGIHKRIDSSYKLALIWFSIVILFSVIYLIVSLFSFESYKLSYPIIRILVYPLFLWYLSKRKDYFYNKEKPFNFEDPINQKQEKIFKWAIIALLTLYILSPAVPVVFDTYKMFAVMNGVADKDVPTALDLCRAKSSSDKDYCISKIVEFKKEKYDFGNGEVCQEISSTKYRNGCYLLLSQCSKITDENIKNICNSLVKISPQTDEKSNLTQRP